jgi:hypothetical protein
MLSCVSVRKSRSNSSMAVEAFKHAKASQSMTFWERDQCVGKGFNFRAWARNART